MNIGGKKLSKAIENNTTSEQKEIKESFYCPLDFCIYDEESGYYSIDNRFILRYEKEIRKCIKNRIKMTDMGDSAVVYNDSPLREKFVSATWNITKYKGVLYGRIDCHFKLPLEENEIMELKEWIVTKNHEDVSHLLFDYPIKTEEGDMNISFFDYSDWYFICTHKELDWYHHERVDAKWWWDCHNRRL